MTKRTIAITVDSDTIQRVRQLNINISGTISEFLENLIASHDQNIGVINIRLEKLERDKAIKKLGYWKSQLNERDNRINNYEEMKAEQEKARLEKEKQEIERKGRCANCGSGKSAKWYPFKIGNVCVSCFLAADKDIIARWSK